jgi:hypothetical protein
MFLIYGAPVLAGIIGSRYLSRLANFLVMMLVFQVDLVILIDGSRTVVFTPYTVLCIIPAMAGILGDRYLGLGKIANACLILGVFYVGGVLLAYQGHGRFIPLLFFQAIFVSAGSLIPPLVFILISLVAHPFRLRWRVVEEAGTYSIRDHMNQSGH